MITTNQIREARELGVYGEPGDFTKWLAAQDLTEDQKLELRYHRNTAKRTGKSR